MDKIKNYISIFIFAFLGGVSRYLLGVHFADMGTIIANVSGCFILAFLTYFFIEFKSLAQWLTVGLGTGFVGAYTTFSSFNLDMLKQIQAGLDVKVLVYFVSSVGLGLIFVIVGMQLGKLAASKLRRYNDE